VGQLRRRVLVGPKPSRRLAFCASLGALTLAASAGCSSASARPTGVGEAHRVTGGRDSNAVLFVRYGEIVSLNPNSGRTSVVIPANSTTTNSAPAWNNSGTAFAFSSATGDDGHAHIVIDSGGKLRRVTFGRHVDGDPSWSPDGRSIVFNRGTHLAVLDLRSGHVRLIGMGLFPSWGPNSNKIVYTGIGKKDGRILMVREDGTRLRTISPRRIYAQSASWSPNGHDLIIATQKPPGTSEDDQVGQLDLLRLATGELRQLTHVGPGVLDSSPSYSPSGTQLVYEQDACSGLQCQPSARIRFRAMARTAAANEASPVGGSPSWS
jgi:Tol biopolymer transport system component